MTRRASAPALHPAAEFLRNDCAAQSSWTVLDTCFGHGHTFAAIRQCWRDAPTRPAMLHYVDVLPLEQAAALQALAQSGDEHTADLVPLCWGMGPGFHRLLLDGGALSITLCVGELPDVLAQQAMQADVVVAQDLVYSNQWAIKALARHCKRGTALYIDRQAPVDLLLLGSAGFVMQPREATEHFAHALYNPHWTLQNSRGPQQVAARAPGTCAVIGAGIAGASVAHALALRGWKVDVLDAAPLPAGGASGLPVGLVVPHHSADDSPRSRMSRAGTRLMLQHAAALQKGKDWNPGGVMELDLDAAELEATEAEIRSTPHAGDHAEGWAIATVFGGGSPLWHQHAAWIKPHRLVAHWLSHPGIQFHGNCHIKSLERHGRQWVLRDAAGAEIGRADTVVFANAFACVELLQQLASDLSADPNEPYHWVDDVLHKLQAMQAIHGTLSMGQNPATTSPTWPSMPVNGHDSFVSGVPMEHGPGWFAGATFQADASAHADLPQEHAANQAKLRTLLPDVAAVLSAQFAGQQVQAWQGTRCVTHDRLPLVGPLEEGPTPTLWLSAGMGARGLSFSALCAELLAAWVGGEPFPIENPLAQGLGTRRPRRQRVAVASSVQGALESRQV